MLNTQNSTNGPGNPANQMHTVRVLIGTMIASLGRDATVGEIVDISYDDFRFLNAYSFVTKKLTEDEAPQSDEAPEAEADDENETTEQADETTPDEKALAPTKAPAKGKPTGKRK